MTPPAVLFPENLLSLAEVRGRLALIFPEGFADRLKLTNTGCARTVFVFLYGGFVVGEGRELRPSYIYMFTDEQTALTSLEDRRAWLQVAVRAGHRPTGKRWYADNSRENIRDDLIRERLIPMGVVRKRGDVPTTSSKPTYSLSREFAVLFSPMLSGPRLAAAIAAWRRKHLDKATLSRLRLQQSGISAGDDDVLVDMPDKTRVRVSTGPSSVILKAIVEQFAPRYFAEPGVLWISASDQKVWPQFESVARRLGLHFSPSKELPDLIMAELSDAVPPRVLFCEIVATDGAITETRKVALLALLRESKLPAECIEFMTAFADRQAAPFRQSVSRLARDTLVWFRSEPDLLIYLRSLPLKPKPRRR